MSRGFQQFPNFARVSVVVVIEVVVVVLVVVFVVVMVDMFVIVLVVVVVVVVLVHFLKFHKDWSRGWQVIPSFAKCDFVTLLICEFCNS